MPAKMIMDRDRSATAVKAAATAFTSHVTQGLAELLEPELADGESLPDLTHLQQLLGRALARRRRVLLAAEVDLAKQKARELRAQRDRAARILYQQLSELRAVLASTFGDGPTARWLGLRGETARDPLALLRQADRAHTRLRDPQRTPPPPKVPIVTTVTPAAWALHLEAPTEALRTALEGVGQVVKQVDDALCEKAVALRAFDEGFIQIAGSLEVLYRLAGKERLAQRIRPSRHRPGRTVREVEPRRRAAQRRRAATLAASKAASAQAEPQETQPVTAADDLGNVALIPALPAKASSRPAVAEPEPSTMARLLPFAPLRRAIGRLGQRRRAG